MALAKSNNLKRKTSGYCIVLEQLLPPAQLETLRRLSPQIEVMSGLANIEKADILYAGDPVFDAALARKLRWVQLNVVGVETLVSGPLARSGLPVANVRGAYSPSVAEFAIGLLLALARQMPRCRQLQNSCIWDDSVCGASLYGKTIGLVGYGSIGRQIARISRSMEMRVLACKRDPEAHWETDSFVFAGTGDADGALPAKWFGTDQMKEMFAESDYVVVSLPLTRETRGLIGASELGALPSHAYLINVGRGAVVDENAVADALSAGKLAGAAVDVFAEEPLPPDSPLWKVPNLLITPHIGSYTTEQAAFAGEVLIENVRRDMAGERLLNLVNFSAGY